MPAMNFCRAGSRCFGHRDPTRDLRPSAACEPFALENFATKVPRGCPIGKRENPSTEFPTISLGFTGHVLDRNYRGPAKSGTSPASLTNPAYRYHFKHPRGYEHRFDQLDQIERSATSSNFTVPPCLPLDRSSAGCGSRSFSVAMAFRLWQFGSAASSAFASTVAR
jgi:hypothetical protein